MLVNRLATNKLFIVMIAASSIVVAGQACAQSSSDWRNDIAYLMRAIKTVHPSPYHRIPESDFDSAAALLSRRVESLTPQQVALQMQAVVALLNDGHSRVQLDSPVFQRSNSFGIRIDRFADGIFVTAASPEFANVVGLRVLRIGDLPAMTAWDSVTKFASGDNAFSRMSNVPRMMMTPDVLAAIGLSDGSSLRLTLADSKGSRTLVANAQPMQFRPEWSTSLLQKSRRVAGSTPLSELHRSESYWFTQRGSVVYAQINQIVSTSDTVDLGPVRGVASLPSFGARLTAFADSVHADRLIIDIRYNDGGNNYLARPVVQSIVEHPLLDQRGKLFVITGRQTYSAAMNFTSMLEERTSAIFVGEAPGGTPAHYGDATRFVMPASKIAFFISTLHWDLGVAPNDVREVMEPDVPAAPLFGDASRGIDAAYEKALAYKEGDRVADQLLAVYKRAGLDSAFAGYDRERKSHVVADPWRSDVQQLLEFAGDVISIAKTRAEIFRAYELVTDRYPESQVAWVSSARVHGFVSDTPGTLAALTRAHELRPQSDFIRRTYEAAKLR